MLETKDLSAVYGEVQALKGVSLKVSRGEVLGLIGPNGAGKSTLVRVISGVLKASGGKVLLDGQDITSYTPNQRSLRIAVVPQARQLGGTFTVEQTVLLGRTPYLGMMGKASPRDKEIVQWAMDQTAVRDLARRRLAEISGGEQQRVLLARALAQKTKVLLLDEPTNHLDLGYQISLLSLLRSLVEEQDLAVIMAMHDLNQVAGYADRVALLIQGHLHAIGNPREVLTSKNIETAYRTPIQVYDHPQTGAPFIIPKSA
ncbi:MAG: ABC transporter ATP-binding protein [Anaerolineales bacterium]